MKGFAKQSFVLLCLLFIAAIAWGGAAQPDGAGVHAVTYRSSDSQWAESPAARGAASAADEAAVRAIIQSQQAEWNRHDAKAYAARYWDDADVVNVEGWWWKGRVQIEQKLTDAFAYVFSESRLTITKIDVRFLTPEVAIAHAGWTMTGARTPRGLAHPSEGLETVVLQKRGGKWRIAAFQNTNYLAEQAFPKQ